MLQFFIDVIPSLKAGRIDFTNFLIVIAFMLITYAIILLVALPFHELSHAYVAVQLGDNTPRWNGRLTANPFAHLDLIGSAMILLFGIGYAKPVPVNPRNFRNPRAGMSITALAGPASNFCMALAGMGLLRLLFMLNLQGMVALIVYDVLLYRFITVNIGLMVFNLLPIPPLDGYRILSYFLPAKILYYVDRYQTILTMFVLLLFATGALSGPMSYLINGTYNLLIKLFMFP